MTATPSDPARAYHYTSAAAFLSIIESGCLRASSTHVLNDRRETVYGLEQFCQYTASGHGGEAADYLMAVLNDEDSFFDSNEYNDIFVVSVYEASTLLTGVGVASAGGCPSCAPWGRW